MFESFPEVHSRRRLDGFFRHLQSNRALLCDTGSQSHDPCAQFGRRHDIVHQSESLCLRRLDQVAGEDQLHRLSFANQAREALSASAAGNDAEVDFRLAEFRCIAGNSQIARHREFHAAAETEPVDHGNDRLREIFDGIESAAALHQLTLGQFGLALEFRDIGASDERFVARARYDEDARIGRRLQTVERMQDLGTRGLIERVPLLRPVDRQQRNAVLRLEQNVLVYHPVLHYMEIAGDRIPLKFLAQRIDVERRDDGTLVLRSPDALRPYARCVGEHLERWAAEKPDAAFLAEREGDGWRKITWKETRRQVHAIATALLSRSLSVERPIAVLSDNSIDHALITLAAMHVGIPVAPVSPAYSLISHDFAKLKMIAGLIEPGLIFVDRPERFERAVASLRHHDFDLVTSADMAALTARTDEAAVGRAFSSLGPDTIAKFLFTSGSTGQPKAVINTQRMLCSNFQSRAQAWPFLDDEPPVLVDWLPWSHTFGGNNDVGLVLGHGGTMYIDAGKPIPGLIETTVRNLREVSPTICLNAPRGYDALLPYLEKDAQLRRSYFARLKMIVYGAAAMPVHIWQRLQQLSIQETGKRVHIAAGWGSTETAPQVTLVHFESTRTGVIGLPTPGCELKMVPIDESDNYELRVRGPNITPGYWKQPDLTADAFDDERFYKMGDAGRLADPGDPAQGVEFAGRLAEDFKLCSGTWVHCGALRVRAISAMAPAVQDIVVAGHDRDDVGFLIFPAAGYRAGDPEVRSRVREGMAALRAEGGGGSTYAVRAILLEEPPSIDAGEITDKGYINQRAVLERRSEAVNRLYTEAADDKVILLQEKTGGHGPPLQGTTLLDECSERFSRHPQST